MIEISTGLAAKLASIAVHADESLSADCHPLDLDALRDNLRDPEVEAWIRQMTAAALAPIKRGNPGRRHE